MSAISDAVVSVGTQLLTATLKKKLNLSGEAGEALVKVAEPAIKGLFEGLFEKHDDKGVIG